MLLKILSLIGYVIIKSLTLTYRFRYINFSSVDGLVQNKKNFILAIWHHNTIAGIFAQKQSPFVLMVSKSKDAEPIDFVIKKQGHKTARGSTSRGGVDKGGKAAKQIVIDMLKEGIPAAITVDGPVGPLHEPKPGTFDMAKKSGAYIVPYTVIPDRYFEFKSWDKFRLPKPFCRVIVIYGGPFPVENIEGLDFAPLQERLKNQLLNDEKIAREQFSKWADLSKVNFKLHG